MQLLVFFLLPLIKTIQCTPVLTKDDLALEKTRKEFCLNGLRVNHNFYALEERRNLSGIPADITVHWKTGNVYFTLITEDMKMHLQVMRDGETESIKVAGLGQSTTVDNLNDIIYLGTDNGVYKYKDDGTIELYSALGEDVMYLAVTSDGQTMYIATWPQNRVQKITNYGQKIEYFPVIPNGHGLTLDPRNNIYFVASKTLYVLKPNSKIPIKIKGMINDKMTNVFVSRADEVYAMDENSNLYSIDPESATAKYIGTFKIEGVNSFALDAAENVLIGIRGAILKYKLYETNPCAGMNTIFHPEQLSGISPISESQTTKAPDSKSKSHNLKRRKHKKTTTTTLPPETSEEDDIDE